MHGSLFWAGLSVSTVLMAMYLSGTRGHEQAPRVLVMKNAIRGMSCSIGRLLLPAQLVSVARAVIREFMHHIALDIRRWRTSDIRAGIILEAKYQSQVGSHTYTALDCCCSCWVSCGGVVSCLLCWKLSVIALARRGRCRSDQHDVHSLKLPKVYAVANQGGLGTGRIGPRVSLLIACSRLSDLDDA